MTRHKRSRNQRHQ